MKEELMVALENEFPFMKRRNSYEQQKAEGMIRDLYGAYGCGCSNGWYDLIRNMCEEITKLYEEEGKPVDLVPLQIKEKFATLRFYYTFEGQDRGICAIDFLGGPSIRIDNASSELHKKVADVIRKWEAKSATICEMCGAPGEIRKDLRWNHTLCEDCYIIRKPRTL